MHNKIQQLHPHLTTITSSWRSACRQLLLGLALAAGGLGGVSAQTNSLGDNPTLDGLRSATYTQPQERLVAVSKLLDLGELELVKTHVEQLAQEQLDAAQLAALHRQFGTALFLQLTNEPTLQPVGREWASRVLDAAAQRARDPQQLAQWVTQLAGADQPAKRYAAIVELRSAGADAVGPLLAAIAAETDTQNLAWLRKGLAQLGEVAVQPLLATLAPPPQPATRTIRQQAMLALGDLDAQQAVPYLIHPYLAGSPDERTAAAAALRELTGGVPSETLAVRILADAVQRQQEAHRALKLEDRVQRETKFWQWTNPGGLSVANYSQADATTRRTAHLASDLYRLRPQNRDFRDRFLLAHLQAGSLTGTLPASPGHSIETQLLAELEPRELEALLASALDAQLAVAARSLCDQIAAVGNRAMLEGASGHRSSLAKALRDPDRGVRFAAARAIVHLDPTRPFPGAADLVHVAEFFATAQGTRRALIVHPRDDEALSVAGWFENLGWAAEAVETPREFLKTGRQKADYELFLISDRVDRPTAGELLQLVRRDPRTAQATVVMMARGADLARAQRRAAGDPLTLCFPFPHSEDTVRGLIQSTTPHRLSSVLPISERLSQAQTALEWFGRWSADRRRYHFYELLESQVVIREALAVPALSALAARTLGNLGTPTAQQALLDSASQLGQSLAVRQAAADGFQRAVRRQGVQLPHSTILEQYARYNQSANFDEATQALLGQILDTIEGPSKEKTM